LISADHPEFCPAFRGLRGPESALPQRETFARCARKSLFAFFVVRQRKPSIDRPAYIGILEYYALATIQRKGKLKAKISI
jgi:hypothetical protein